MQAEEDELGEREEGEEREKEDSEGARRRKGQARTASRAETQGGKGNPNRDLEFLINEV